MACSANPSSVFPGDPVTVTATADGLDPALHSVYSWSGAGVTGNGTTATVATASLPPGSYTVKCGVKEGKPGQEGLKPWQAADASASFTVKAFQPPKLSCSANPSVIKPGDSATITTIGVSPRNRPLTYSYSADAGTVSGSGATATFNSAGAPPGQFDITCTVTDDSGQAASATASVTVVAAMIPPLRPTKKPLAFHCDATPSSIRPGQLVSFKVAYGELQPGDQVTWSVDPARGALSQEHGNAWFDTGGLASGQYTAEASISRQGTQAHCDATFTVDPNAKLLPLPDIGQAAELLPPSMIETPGFAMYTYVLARSAPSTSAETILLHAIVKAAIARGGAEDSVQPPAQSIAQTGVNVVQPQHSNGSKPAMQLGIIYLPVNEAYHPCQANQVAHCTQVNGDPYEVEAHWIVDEGHYDAGRARNLLSSLACDRADAPNSCSQRLSGEGPYLITTLIRLSSNHPSSVLIQDLGGTNPDTASQWVQKFLEVASNQENWTGNTMAKRLLGLGAVLDRAGFSLQQIGEAKSTVLAIIGLK
jgi:hypothetical protein